jgi:hypothetical protein
MGGGGGAGVGRVCILCIKVGKTHDRPKYMGRPIVVIHTPAVQYFHPASPFVSVIGVERQLGYTRVLTRSALLDLSHDVCGVPLNALIQVLTCCHHRMDHPTPHPSIRLLQTPIGADLLTFDLCGTRINGLLTNSHKGPNYLHISPSSIYISPLIGILHSLYSI